MKTLMFLAIFSLVLVGCASQSVSVLPMIETLRSPDEKLVETHTRTVTKISPEGTTTESTKEATELNATMAEYKLKQAILAQQNQAQVNPCGGWNPPAWCVGGYGNGYQSYSNGGYVQSYQPSYNLPPPGTAYGTSITYRTH